MMMDPTLPQQYISRSHATITATPRRRCGRSSVNLSLNGTKVDTRALVRDESTDLYPGEAVVFGAARRRPSTGTSCATATWPACCARSGARSAACSRSQRRAAERVYAPSGAGYHEAASSFAGAASQQSTQQEASQPAASSSALDAFFDDDDEPAAAAKRPLDAAPSPPRKRERVEATAAESPVSPVLSVGEPSAAAAAACEDRLDGDDADDDGASDGERIGDGDEETRRRSRRCPRWTLARCRRC